MPPARRDGRLPRVILCAALTVDGKLAADEQDPTRWPWAARGDDASTVVWPAAAAAAPAAGEWHRVLRRMRRLEGARQVICLGDAARFRALLDAGLVTELWLVVRPSVDGRREAPTLSGPAGAPFFLASVAAQLVKMEMRAGECFLRYRIRREAIRPAAGRVEP